MTNKTNKLASAVSNSLSSGNNTKQGRPAKTEHENLISIATKDFIDYEDAQTLFINKNSIKNKSPKEAAKIRKQNSRQLQIAKNIVILEERLEFVKDKIKCQNLIKEIKRLTAYLSKIQHKIHHEDATRPLGKPTSPDALILERAVRKSNTSYSMLNKHERQSNLPFTNKEKIKKMANARRNKKIGRNKNSELQNLDKSIRKEEKNRINVLHNIKLQSILKGPNMGRKKHGEEKLEEVNNLLKILHHKVKLIEDKMSSQELTQRHISQLTCTRQGLLQKQYHIKNDFEKKKISKELIIVNQAISDKQHKLKRLNKPKKPIKKAIKRNSQNVIVGKIPSLKKSDCELNLLVSRLKKALIENIALKSNFLQAINDMDNQQKSA